LRAQVERREEVGPSEALGVEETMSIRPFLDGPAELVGSCTTASGVRWATYVFSTSPETVVSRIVMRAMMKTVKMERRGGHLLR
jgi:hypothetical protein